MLRAIKVRLYPNKEQEQTINKVLGCYRFVYNYMLALKKKEYEENGKSLGRFDLTSHLHNTLLKDEQYAWLKEQRTHVMYQAIRQMLVAYDNFFKHHKGFPKFKTKKSKQSAAFPLETISKRNTFNDKKITLTQPLSNIRFRCSDLYLNWLQTYKDGIRFATLTKTKSGKYFLTICIDLPQEELTKFEHTGNRIGIDLGINDFVITSDGEKFENKRFFKSQDEKRIKKLQKRLSRKQHGSKNYEKQRVKLAKAFERITNQRDAYIHSVTNELLNRYDTVFMEDLNVKGMVKDHRRSKHIIDVSWGRFRRVLEYKAENNDKNIEFVGTFFPSSQLCHKCGYRHKGLKKNETEWTCPNCGTHHDRDVNAAINILMEGERKSTK